jgi:hypothetical protein
MPGSDMFITCTSSCYHVEYYSPTDGTGMSQIAHYVM